MDEDVVKPVRPKDGEEEGERGEPDDEIEEVKGERCMVQGVDGEEVELRDEYEESGGRAEEDGSQEGLQGS